MNYTGLIYKATCILNNKCYIGQTKHTLENRKNGHIKESLKDNGKYKNTKFIRAIKKYGCNNFFWEIIEYCYSKEELSDKEKYWIKTMDSVKNGYNITNGGIGGWGKGKYHSNYGKHLSKDTIQKIRNSLLGRKPRYEEIEKMRLTKIGSKMPEYFKIKMRERYKDKTNHPTYGLKPWNYGKLMIIKSEEQLFNILKMIENKCSIIYIANMSGFKIGYILKIKRMYLNNMITFENFKNFICNSITAKI